MKKRILTVLLALSVPVSLTACMGAYNNQVYQDDSSDFEDDEYYEDFEDYADYEEDDGFPDDKTFFDGSETESADINDIQPAFDFKGTGNFTDISEIWNNGDVNPADYVGAWCEDGFSEGYRLEIYGDGTWQFFGSETTNGYIEVMSNGLLDFYDSKYGVFAAKPYVYQTDGKTKMNITVYADCFYTRNPSDNLVFYREEDSVDCDDLDAYYAEKYPYSAFEGEWHPVGDDSNQFYFVFDAEGNWSVFEDLGSQEFGILEEAGNGLYTSKSVNMGEDYTFEFPGDGYMYYDGVQYEVKDPEEEKKELIVDKWHFYDYDNGGLQEDGYEFFNDGTFTTLTDNQDEESGTYVIFGDNLLMFDEEGRQIHNGYFDIYYARNKHILFEKDKDLYGEDGESESD